jgi:hypothetical protein
MRNLLEETIEKIEDCGHTTDEVKFVTDCYVYCNWEDFAQAAKNYNYDEGFGDTEVNINLEVVGSDWWLERDEYDGSEWWEYKSIPTAPNNYGEVDFKDE